LLPNGSTDTHSDIIGEDSFNKTGPKVQSLYIQKKVTPSILLFSALLFL